MVGELGLGVGEIREPFRPFLAKAGERDESFVVVLLLGSCAGSRCWRLAFSPTASCQSTGCAVSSRGILVWDVWFVKGFCFCFVNMIFSNRSDFTFCAKLPSYEELHPPYVLSWMQVCASWARAGLRGELRRLFRGRFGGFSARRISPRWLRLRAGLFLPREDREARRLGGGDVLALLRRHGLRLGPDSVLPLGWSLST